MSVIETNKVVTLTYKLSVDGQFVEEADKETPLLYIAGIGAMIPGFERQLLGKVVGDSYKITIAPEDGYGTYNDQAVVDLPFSTFEVDGKVNMDYIKVGAKVPMQDEEGNPLDGIILEIGKDFVKVDFNDILAGKTLEFEGEILNVRSASAEELSHGHVHGPGGVEH